MASDRIISCPRLSDVQNGQNREMAFIAHCEKKLHNLHVGLSFCATLASRDVCTLHTH